ncbi:hypothetical protein BBO99_00005266 [Phytophthora kernoviae]|uniref:Fibronectin type-III domain-containing protein n=2 Tax=Phytophthora kernoviae TaxID=325452 RepID=A0A3R7NFQ5_9STRA|nr:hypothetical protein G195_006677 [Phytophthora kernoviae 00238/432]KAG2524757.1 hypothetical protein JM18_005265 [Phytophthora kernoviae]RLN06517.1 hypothetical protein BBI17_004599 [Phytophthora kernoviae]RLN79427.1 hypothetical protein BBO99_00005266 [Phytophthora kernoviae]
MRTLLLPAVWLSLGQLHATTIADVSVPSPPLNVALGVLGPDALAVSWEPPISDGGAPVSAYLVEWDPDPGAREVQVVQTSANTGANEVQTVQTYAGRVREKQRVTTSATPTGEVQTITTSAAPGETLGGVFTLELDTRATGGSVQRSGVIGFNARTSGDRSGLLEILNAMQNIGPSGVQSVQKSTADAQGGITWTILFSTAMGNVPQLTLSSNFLTGSGANVVVNTPTQGNTISGGTFTLGFKGATTKDLTPDISDVGMQQALEALNTIESVDVKRVGPDAQNGYYWDITFTGRTNWGDLPYISVPKKALIGVGANVAVTEQSAGNQLKGSFKLLYDAGTGATPPSTGNLPWNCDTATMKSQLEGLSGVGTVDVARTEMPDTQGGYTWTVSFLTAKGSLNIMTSNIASLSETRTDNATPSMGVRITRTRPGTKQEMQDIKVTTTTTVKQTTTFQLQVTFAGQTTQTKPIPANPLNNGVCMSTEAEIQTISVATVDTTATGGDFIVSKQTAIRLVYESNTKSGAISMTNPIYVDHTCTWHVTFDGNAGNLPLMTVSTDGGNTFGSTGTNNLGDLPALRPDGLTLSGTAPKIDVTEATKGVAPPYNSKDRTNASTV